MLSTIFLVVLAPLSFEGGSPDAFAEAYFRATNEPVAVVATESSLPAIEIEAETQMGRNTAIDRATPLRRAGDALNSFGFDLWPSAGILIVAGDGRNPFQPAGTEPFPNRPPLPAENVRIEDGMVTVVPEAERYVTLAGLARLDWSRPLTAHWIVARIPVAVRAVEMPEERFLRMVASAAGARLTIGRRSIDAQPDIAVYRRTRIAELEAQERRAALDPIGRWSAARLRAQIDTLRFVPAESLRRSIASPTAIEEFEAPAISALGQVGLTYLSRLREIERTLRPGETSPPGLFGLIAEPPVVHIRLDGNGQISVMFLGRQPGMAVSP
jgi:hypothetical protein